MGGANAPPDASAETPWDLAVDRMTIPHLSPPLSHPHRHQRLPSPLKRHPDHIRLTPQTPFLDFVEDPRYIHKTPATVLMRQWEFFGPRL